ncbi:MAG: YwaF family protein, partial [Solirubrobacterales bacterium]|nr:YwaF family protein [Solirubrobacterales bacterium]
MRQFSSAHIAALAVLMGACAAAIVLPRRYPGDWVWTAARALAVVIIAGWAGEYIAEVIVGTWRLGYSLPLQLTDAVSIAAILALLTRRQPFIDLVYYWAFSSTLQAALTPDLGPGQSFPSVF